MTKIYYFSGTGNSLWSAGEIARAVGGECTLVNIGPEAWKGETVVEADAVVMVFPSYAYGLPLAVRRFAMNAVFRTPYLAAFVTYGSKPGGTLAALSRIIGKKNIDRVYFGRIPAVENYIAIFGSPKEKTARRRLEMQARATGEAARSVMERRTNRVNNFRPFSAFVWRLFAMGLGSFYKHYRVSGDCDGCRVCEKMCPVSAVSVRGDPGNARPVFSAKCEHCQGCLNWCPKKAIHFGRQNSRAAQYRHPEISLGDISRQAVER
ncbi:MAG: EFR1 family ferrodoxin [Treponema sp.]|nr:EFR1 family ferrodoxin [Treponema sp.]